MRPCHLLILKLRSSTQEISIYTIGNGSNPPMQMVRGQRPSYSLFIMIYSIANQLNRTPDRHNYSPNNVDLFITSKPSRCSYTILHPIDSSDHTFANVSLLTAPPSPSFPLNVNIGALGALTRLILRKFFIIISLWRLLLHLGWCSHLHQACGRGYCCGNGGTYPLFLLEYFFFPVSGSSIPPLSHAGKGPDKSDLEKFSFFRLASSFHIRPKSFHICYPWGEAFLLFFHW